jgi:hypothetical protein
MADTEHDEPTWVTLVHRLRSIGEQYGQDTEVGWLVNLAADQIVNDNQKIARLEV